MEEKKVRITSPLLAHAQTRLIGNHTSGEKGKGERFSGWTSDKKIKCRKRGGKGGLFYLLENKERRKLHNKSQTGWKKRTKGKQKDNIYEKG